MVKIVGIISILIVKAFAESLSNLLGEDYGR